ncbi:F0F1 ATP synthase subunit epsilon [Haloactinomyces albus]|uniref:ATP synthase epsilon chain n=1 Tax=Haloactinomyces albus TaxID=1352928 RepID=A0AAE4CL99_9ACTN|nr:F0F1 ATP synthase subunit epsilon [Haloactinomyces albus]MDR7301136.1 F-type H+-transporting ATPase subunit epsilon [Haloactinomyces albus]
MANMSVQLVAVERRLWSGDATTVVAQTTEGEIGILPGHEPLLGRLTEGGVVTITTPDHETVTAAVHGGFLSVSESVVSILAESAELAQEIDIARARQEAEGGDEQTRARAMTRLRVAGQSA